MASTINWPISLPQRARRNSYTEKHGVLVTSTPMDAGPAKLRRRGNKPVLLTAEYIMTAAQLDTLETFVKTTLMGVKRFNHVHPRTLASVEVRLVPTGDGEYYSFAYISSTEFSVSLTFEILP
jgi:hypothetical protein